MVWFCISQFQIHLDYIILFLVKGINLLEVIFFQIMDFIVGAIKAGFLIIIEILRNGIHREFVTHAENR